MDIGTRNSVNQLKYQKLPSFSQNKSFRFCKVLITNIRPHKDYFSLHFVTKQDQPIKGVLNYRALNELNKRWHLKYPSNGRRGESILFWVAYSKCTVQLLWNQRRYVNPNKGAQTAEPQQTLERYRNPITLNDTTAKPGKNGCFFLVKQGGHIRVGDSVDIGQTQFNILRTNRQKSHRKAVQKVIIKKYRYQWSVPIRQWY